MSNYPESNYPEPNYSSNQGSDQRGNNMDSSAPMSSYFNPHPAALDPGSSGPMSEPQYYGADRSSGVSGNGGYGRAAYQPNYSPNYARNNSYSQRRSGCSRDYSAVQSWQERDDAQIGAFGMHSHRGKGSSGFTRSDQRIKEDVCERLINHHYIDASAINVEVEAGVVTLDGSVGDRWQKYQAEDLIDATSGVKDINNRLTVGRVGPTEPHSDATDNGRTAALATTTKS